MATEIGDMTQIAQPQIVVDATKITKGATA
jgi:hypothetical protein